MSKTHWITVALDGSADEDRIRMLIDMSYEATATNVEQRVLRCGGTLALCEALGTSMRKA